MRITLALAGRFLYALALGYLIYIALLFIIPHIFPKKVSQEHQKTLDALDFSPRSSPDRVALIETPEDAFRWRMQLLQGAERSIDIAYHTIGSGITSEYFFGEVLRQADQGVKVRFIVDGKVGGMSGNHISTAYALFTHPNVEYKVYNPPGVLTPWRWNALLHDKFILVDDKFLLLGGRNIGDIYFNPPEHQGRLTLDRDVFVLNTSFGTKITQESVLWDVKEYMDQLMNHQASRPAYRVLNATKRALGSTTHKQLVEQIKAYEKENPQLFELPSLSQYLERTVTTQGITLLSNPIETGSSEPWVGYSLAKLALQTKESLWIQTPYATANKKLLQVLSQVGDKNIEYHMLTNSIGSTPNFPAYSNYYYNRKKFLATGVTLHEFQERKGLERGSIHAKSYLFDHELSAVGSFNLDDRSMYLSTETMLIIHSQEFNSIMRSTLADWGEDSLIVGEDNRYHPGQQVPVKKPPVIKRAIMFLASIVSRIFQFLI